MEANRFRFRFMCPFIHDWQYFELGDFKKVPPEVLASQMMYAKDWQQSTGLTDKNGKEIFEGDVCIFGPGIIPSTYEIFWSETRWLGRSGREMIDLLLLQRQSFDLEDYYCEVISSIYERPELLKEKQ